MGTVTLLPETTKNPITLMGQRAGVCWGGDTTDPAKNYKRGMDCIMSGHGRVMEYVNVECVLDGYSARVIREWYTHIAGGPTRLQSSTRFIDYGAFDYVTPPKIRTDNNRNKVYESTMRAISEGYSKLQEMGVPKEDIGMMLPLGMTTRIVDQRNLRRLVDMSRQRECSRAYHEYRALFDDLKTALQNYSDEWKTVVEMLFMPKCEMLGYCPETKSCGRMPKGQDEQATVYAYAVITTYSFDAPALRLCKTEKEAEDFLAENFNQEVAADADNGWNTESELHMEEQYGKIVNHFDDHDDVTEFYIVSL